MVSWKVCLIQGIDDPWILKEGEVLIMKVTEVTKSMVEMLCC